MNTPQDRRVLELNKVAARFLRRRAPAGVPTGNTLWDATFFGLQHVDCFDKTSVAGQASVLAGCAAALLSESLMIERSGVVFCAKMVQLAERVEERRLFALIGADEATHSVWLEPWLADDAPQVDPFNRFITGMVETGSAQPLTYLLQVVLEGFGIVHYSNLAAACHDPALAATLATMAQDEALHHGAGLAAFSVRRLGAPERTFLSEATYTFLQMIRAGPQSVVAAVDHVLGINSLAEATSVFEELICAKTSAAKLERLRRLMAQPGMAPLIVELEDKGAFDPCTPAQCAQIYFSAR